MSKSTKPADRRGRGGSIYDDVLRTIQERRSELLIPLINEIFSTDYPPDTLVTRLPEEYQKLVSKVVADSCNVIGDHVYHIEFQSHKDKTMVVRMIEYDFVIGLSGAEQENGKYRIRFPRSCVIYLRSSKKKTDKEEMELIFQDGQVVTYSVPAINAQDYSLEELFDKKLYIYLPFYIMRYEKEFQTIAEDEEKERQLLDEYLGILNRMQMIWRERPDIYQDMSQLIKRVIKYQLRNQEKLQKEVMDAMGGKVLPLPSDKLREEREEGRQEGQFEKLVENIENLMRLQQWDLKKASEAIGSSEEEYYRAKEGLNKQKN